VKKLNVCYVDMKRPNSLKMMFHVFFCEENIIPGPLSIKIARFL